MSSKFKISIVKDAMGSKCHIDDMSVGASKAFVKILQAVNKIVESENDSNIKIKLVEGSAGIEIDAPIRPMKNIQESISDVIEKKSVKTQYLIGMRDLQKLFKANGLTYTSEIKFGNQEIHLVDKLKEIKDIRAPKKISDKDYIDIEFFKGKLIENGGKSPNIHIETQNERYKINCTSESQARRVRNELYQNVRISAWVTKSPDKKFVYTFCDYYEDGAIFQELKDVVSDIIVGGGTAPLELIHEKFYEFISNKRFEDARLFVKTFCHTRVNNNVLRTLLLVTKGMKDRDEFQDLVMEITDILLKKTKKPIL